MELENLIMELIINAGASRSSSIEALQAARNKRWSDAEELMASAKESARNAHLVQTQLIGEDEGVGKIKVNLVMVHAQDHLMNAMLCRELVEEMIALHRLVDNLENKA